MTRISAHSADAAVQALPPSPDDGSSEHFDDLVCGLVGLLRERRPAGLRSVLEPVLAQRNRALAGELSSAGAAVLAHYDRLILTALAMRYDALDGALTATRFAVAEIDGNGTISYANAALLDLLDDAVGRDFAALFGPRSQEVQHALQTDTRDTLRLDLHRGNKPSVHLRGEIGPLLDERKGVGAYALLLSLEGEEARLNALPDGILRLDPAGHVTLANPGAAKIFGVTENELLGRSATSLLAAALPSEGEWPPSDWLDRDGHKVEIDIDAVEGGGTTPVRITIVPSFDTADSRSGWMLTLVPIAEERVQAEIQRQLSLPGCEPEELIAGVIQAIRGIVDFDFATFGVYTEDMSHHNTLVVQPQPSWNWTTAWFPLKSDAGDSGADSSKVKEFLGSQKTWGNDLVAKANELTPGLSDDEVMLHLVDDGMKGYSTLPITGGGERIRASLTLLSKQADRYDGSELEKLRALGVEEALLVAEANIQRRQEDRIRALETALTRASGYAELALALATGVADCFGWDYVAVFGVDRKQGCFRLIRQCNRTGHPDVDAGYSQSLDEGLLGKALRNNSAATEPNIGAGSANGYKAVVPGRRSALAMPIWVVRQAPDPIPDEIEWLLSVESAQRNAFQGPAMISLQELLQHCQGILLRRWQTAVQDCLLDAAEQAVVIVDRAGKIRLTNRWANTLFGCAGERLLGQDLAARAQESDASRLLASTDQVERVPVTLRVSDADVTPVVMAPILATQRPVGDDYGHRLWLFTDLREQAYQSEWRYLEQTVNEVAQNVRVPLMLATSLVSNAKRLLKQSSVASMLENAVRQIDKADITYERLASTLAIRQDPDRPPQSFDALAVLTRALADFPKDDIARVDASDLKKRKAAGFIVAGWPEQLTFAFRSLLEFLILRCPSDEKVRIALKRTPDDALQISFSVPTGSSAASAVTDASDPIAMAEHHAKQAAALAPETVELAVRRHDGKFWIDTDDKSSLAFGIMLHAKAA